MPTPKDDLARELATAQQILKEFSEFAYDSNLALDLDEEVGEVDPTAENVAQYLRDLDETLTKIEKAFREL